MDIITRTCNQIDQIYCSKTYLIIGALLFTHTQLSEICMWGKECRELWLTYKLRFHLYVMWIWRQMRMTNDIKRPVYVSPVWGMCYSEVALCMKGFPVRQTIHIRTNRSWGDSFCCRCTLHSHKWKHSYTNSMIFLKFCCIRIRHLHYAQGDLSLIVYVSIETLVIEYTRPFLILQFICESLLLVY